MHRYADQPNLQRSRFSKQKLTNSEVKCEKGICTIYLNYSHISALLQNMLLAPNSADANTDTSGALGEWLIPQCGKQDLQSWHFFWFVECVNCQITQTLGRTIIILHKANTHLPKTCQSPSIIGLSSSCQQNKCLSRHPPPPPPFTCECCDAKYLWNELNERSWTDCACCLCLKNGRNLCLS